MRESANRGIRIAKFTMDAYANYGNVLQNYALQQILLCYADRQQFTAFKPLAHHPKPMLAKP